MVSAGDGTASTSTVVPSEGAVLCDITMSPWKLRVTVPQKLSQFHMVKMCRVFLFPKI